jgi:hypothetical protein
MSHTYMYVCHMREKYKHPHYEVMGSSGWADTDMRVKIISSQPVPQRYIILYNILCYYIIILYNIYNII